MFLSCNSHSKEVERILAKQRAKEMATKGHSKIQLAKVAKKPAKVAVQPEKTVVIEKDLKSSTDLTLASTGSKSSKKDNGNVASASLSILSDDLSLSTAGEKKQGYAERKKAEKEAAIAKVSAVIKATKGEIEECSKQIKTLYELSKVRVEANYAEKIIALSYRRLMMTVDERSSKERVVNGLVALKENLEGDYAMPGAVDEEMKEVIKFSGTSCRNSKLSDKDLVTLLKKKMAEEKRDVAEAAEESAPISSISIETEEKKKKGRFGGLFSKSKK